MLSLMESIILSNVLKESFIYTAKYREINENHVNKNYIFVWYDHGFNKKNFLNNLLIAEC